MHAECLALRTCAQFCSLFAKNPQCLNMIESMYCSLTCNPDAGSYVKLSGKTAATVAVCDTFADSIYSSCSTMLIPGLNQPLKSFIDNSNVSVRTYAHQWRRPFRQCCVGCDA